MTAALAEQTDPRELMARAQAGDPDAFGALARQSRPYVHEVIRRRCDADPDDLTQETFLRAWRYLDHYRPDGPSVNRWLAAIARHVVIDHYRMRTSSTRCDERPVETLADLPETGHDPYAAVDDHAQVVALLAALTDGQRQVLELHYMAGLSGPEIAAALSVADGTVKSRLTYARRAARQLMEETNA